MLYVATYIFTLQENTMKTLRPLCAALALTMVVAVSSSAGDMHTTAQTPQPAPTPVAVGGDMSTPVNGDMHTGDGGEVTAGEAVAAAALELVQSVLSLL